jgi:hypothetical protein
MQTNPRNPYRRIAGAAPRPAVPQATEAPNFNRVAARPKTHFTSKQDENVYDEGGNFNPRAYGGWREDIRQAVPSTDRMFGKSGNLNFSDNRDALTQIAYLLQNVTKTAGAKFYRPDTEAKMNKEARREVLAAAMQDPTGEGFAIVGQELLLPIKAIIDYEGWARKIFRVRPLSQGELFRIAKDVRATAWVVGQDGQSIESRLYGRYIQPSECKVTSFPTVDISDIYQMNFDVLDRAQDTARQEIELEEDKRAVSILDRAAQTVNAVTLFTTLGISAFEDVRYQVERHRLIVEKFLIARAELSDIVKTMSTQVDPVTERELILAGYIGNILNAQIVTTAGTGVEEVVVPGTFYAVTGSEYLGEMGVRIELFSEPFNKYAMHETVKGWALCEEIGYGIPNSRSAAKGTK